MLWLNLAAPRTALIYSESPCDLGQQICGIRSVARMLRNASQTASCTSQLQQPATDHHPKSSLVVVACCMLTAGFATPTHSAAHCCQRSDARLRYKPLESVYIQEAVGRVSCALSAYLSHRSQKGPVPDVLIQITITQGLVMGRWCGLSLLAVLNTL